MIKFIREKKRKSKKRKSNLVLLVIVTFLGLIFYISDKCYNNQTIATFSKNSIKDTLSKLSIIATMNLRESRVNPKELPIDSSNINVVYKSNGHKIAYLTFDDGPSAKITPAILKILDHYNIKATFFIIGSMAIINPSIIKMEFKDGQSIGNHTYSHDYKYLYSNPNALINDVNKCDTVLKLIIGSSYNSKLIRFPGGSFGSKMAPFRSAIKNDGYHYIDWNDITGDAEGQNITVNKLLNNLKKYTIGKEHVVILMHDTRDKETTVQALPQVVEYLKYQGYSFNKLK